MAVRDLRAAREREVEHSFSTHVYAYIYVLTAAAVSNLKLQKLVPRALFIPTHLFLESLYIRTLPAPSILNDPLLHGLNIYRALEMMT